MKNQTNNSVFRNAVENNTVINTNEVYNPVANAVVKAIKSFSKSTNGCKIGYIQIDGDTRLKYDGSYFIAPSNGKYCFIFNAKIQVKRHNIRYNEELVKVHVCILDSESEISLNIQFNSVMDAIMEQIEKYNEIMVELNEEWYNEKPVDVIEENNTIENDVMENDVMENMPEESMEFISPDILNDVKSITPMDIIKEHNIDEKGLRIKVYDIIPVEPYENINLGDLWLEIEKNDDDYDISLISYSKYRYGYSTTEFLYDNESIYDAIIKFKKQWAKTIIDRILILDDDTINIDAPINYYKDDIDYFIELYNNNLLPDDIKFDADTRIEKELFEKYLNNKNDNNMELIKQQIKDACTYALLNGKNTDWGVVAETLNKIINENPNIPNEDLIESCKSLINKIVTYTSICGSFSEVQIVDNLMRITKIYKIVDNWF